MVQPPLFRAGGLREPPKEPFEALYERYILCLWSEKSRNRDPLQFLGGSQVWKLSHLSDDQLEKSRSPARYCVFRALEMGQKSYHLPNPRMNGHLLSIQLHVGTFATYSYCICSSCNRSFIVFDPEYLGLCRLQELVFSSEAALPLQIRSRDQAKNW